MRPEAKAAKEKTVWLAEEAKRKAEEEAIAAYKILEDGTVGVLWSLMLFVSVFISLPTSHHVPLEAKATKEKAVKLAEEATREVEEEAIAARKKLEDGTVCVLYMVVPFVRLVNS
jgi:hypothetical protein